MQNNLRRGQITFQSFNSFLLGTASSSTNGDGINSRILRATDYSLCVQDDCKFSPKLILNLGLRYELDLPPYETRGALTTFDPSLYTPRMELDGNGIPVGPPIGGFVQAGNVIPQYDLPDVPNVGKRIVKSIDPNNFAPRIGFAYSPLESGRLVMRGGFGIFYSRISFTHMSTAIQLPPNYIVGRRFAADVDKPTFANPFFAAPSVDKFPSFVPGIDLA